MRSPSLLVLLALPACAPAQPGLPPDALRAMESTRPLVSSPVFHLAFSADGKLIQSLSKGVGLLRWKVADGKREGPMFPRAGMGCGVLFRDGEGCVLASYQSVHVFRPHQREGLLNFDT